MTVTLHIDTQKTGNFAHASDNVSNTLISAQSFIGLSNVTHSIASDTQCQIILLDEDGKYSVDTRAGTNVLGCMVRLRVSNITVFTGWIKNVQASQTFSGYTTVLDCGGRMNFLVSRIVPETDLQENVLLRNKIIEIFQNAPITFPYPGNVFTLNHSQLNGSDRIYGGTAAQSGYTLASDTARLPLAMPTREESAGALLEAAIGYSLGGRFFERRDGKFEYQNKDHDGDASVGSNNYSAADFDSIEAVQGGVINDVTVQYIPREVKNNAIMFRLGGGAVSVPNAEQEAGFRYFDPIDDEVVDVQRISVASNTIRFTGNKVDPDDEDEAPPTVSGRFVHPEDDPSSFRVVLSKEGDGAGFVTAINVTGKGVFTKSGEEVRFSRVDSKLSFGNLQSTRVGNRYITSRQRAEVHANAVLDHFSHGSLRYTRVSLLDPDDDAVRLTIGDAVNIRNANTGHARDYVIIGEQFAIGNGLVRLIWTLTLKQKAAAVFRDPEALRYRNHIVRFRNHWIRVV